MFILSNLFPQKLSKLELLGVLQRDYVFLHQKERKRTCFTSQYSVCHVKSSETLSGMSKYGSCLVGKISFQIKVCYILTDLIEKGEIRHDEICLDWSEGYGSVILLNCHGQEGNQKWSFNKRYEDDFFFLISL